MTRILLIGGGITSAVTGSILRQLLPKAELFIWDKAKGAGGRMSTTRNRKTEKSVLDLGAQYITVTPDYAELHSTYYSELKDNGLLVNLTGKIGGMKHTSGEISQHFVTPKGVSSLVKHYFKKSQADVKFNQPVFSLNYESKKWHVATAEGIKDTFDIVVLTMPVPQILGLSGSVKQLIENQSNLLEQLRSVEYSSRYALGLFFEEGSLVTLEDGNCAQYLTNDPAVRFVSLDSVKRGSADCCPSAVIHTSVPFGKANVEKTPAEMEIPLLSKVKEMFPHWPEPDSVKCQKWRYSQVTSSFPGLPGAIEIGEGLIACGDAFTHSNLDGCIESAKAASEKIVRYITEKSYL